MIAHLRDVYLWPDIWLKGPVLYFYWRDYDEADEDVSLRLRVTPQPTGAQTRAVGARRSTGKLRLRLQASISQHMSEHRSDTSVITPTQSMWGSSERVLRVPPLCPPAPATESERSQTDLKRCPPPPHLSAEIRSPNKSTMIKDLLSSSLSAHKVEQ